MQAKPPILVTETDLEQLQQFLASRDVSQEAAVDALEEELARARVIAPHEAPPTLVTMNSRVVFESALTGKRREVTLVYPEEADPAQGRISVTSPVGAALLGLSVGQEIDWELPNGRPARFRIAEVTYQPEAAGER